MLGLRLVSNLLPRLNEKRFFSGLSPLKSTQWASRVEFHVKGSVYKASLTNRLSTKGPSSVLIILSASPTSEVSGVRRELVGSLTAHRVHLWADSVPVPSFASGPSRPVGRFPTQSRFSRTSARSMLLAGFRCEGTLRWFQGKMRVLSSAMPSCPGVVRPLVTLRSFAQAQGMPGAMSEATESSAAAITASVTDRARTT
jgi:hypothetical protein